MVRHRCGSADVGRRGAPFVRVVFAALLLAACGEAPTVPESEEPMLHLVLNQRTLSHHSDYFGQHALLLTSGSPLESPRYRRAERFEMRRASDGRRFDWRAYSNLPDTPGTVSGISMAAANYYLVEESSAVGLGAADLRSGERYELGVETGGRTVRGSVLIPAPFAASVERRDGRTLATWPTVTGAAGYLITASDGSHSLQVNTRFVVPAGVARGGSLTVQALDPNLYRYMSERRTGRAGIEGAFGVLGAVSMMRVEFAE